VLNTYYMCWTLAISFEHSLYLLNTHYICSDIVSVQQI
jgi:hypothetical protein